MSKPSWYYTAIIGLAMLASCRTKQITYTAPHDEDLQEELLDTMVISDVAAALDSMPKEYRPSATLEYDIIHTRLDLRFDRQKQHVLGKATLTVTPYFRPISQVALDAVGFIIHDVKDATTGKALQHSYDNNKLTVSLPDALKGKAQARIEINYTARPNENKESTGMAITSDKGLFFIDPLDQDPDVPFQIWTQGETENNSRWFPTFDKPNERFSQEILLTVEDKYVTLSNGKLISSKNNNDGTRTDHWKQDKPHAPYLAMIAVGEFFVQNGSWNGLPLMYMVDKPYGPYAEKIFGHTPEMLQFFSDKLAYPYPWDKYGQVAVKDFVSGAMENTGAVVFGDFVQKTDRELIDNDNDNIVAHEMMHHWFGDLVTCESWSNLTLNEGFANYAEYLWNEHKYGVDKADYHRLEELNGYMSQVFGGGARSLIDYHYEDKENMFDAHSYNKGGLVLHMLRSYVGEDAFFASLNRYLRAHEGTAVEVDELRMAFEDTTGEDLHWFFDQWFDGVGHPYLDVTYTYNPGGKVLLVEVDQSKTPQGFHQPFILPVNIALYYKDGSVTHHPATITDVNQRILIEDLKADPVTYVLDGKNDLLALINENKTQEQYEEQFRLSPNVMDKIMAFTSTGESNPALISKALEDRFYVIRTMGIGAITDSLVSSYSDKLKILAVTDPHSEVRSAALARLLNMPDNDPLPLCQEILRTEKAYPVLQMAIEAVGTADPLSAKGLIRRFGNEDSDYLSGTLVRLLQDESPESLDYIEERARKVNTNYIFDYYGSYGTYLAGKSLPTLQRSTAFLRNVAGAQTGNVYRKYMAMSTLIKIAEDLRSRVDAGETEAAPLAGEVSDIISDIVKNEKDPMLMERYSDIK